MGLLQNDANAASWSPERVSLAEKKNRKHIEMPMRELRIRILLPRTGDSLKYTDRSISMAGLFSRYARLPVSSGSPSDIFGSFSLACQSNRGNDNVGLFKVETRFDGHKSDHEIYFIETALRRMFFYKDNNAIVYATQGRRILKRICNF